MALNNVMPLSSPRSHYFNQGLFDGFSFYLAGVTIIDVVGYGNPQAIAAMLFGIYLFI
jgi:hypothetical protein